MLKGVFPKATLDAAIQKANKNSLHLNDLRILLADLKGQWKYEEKFEEMDWEELYLDIHDLPRAFVDLTATPPHEHLSASQEFALEPTQATENEIQ